MYNGAESIEHVNAYHQELSRQLDRAAREIEVERLLAPANADRGAGLGAFRPAGIVATLAGWLRPGRRMEELPGG